MARKLTAAQEAQVALIKAGYEPGTGHIVTEGVINFEHGWEGSTFLCHRCVELADGTTRTDLFRVYPDGGVSRH